MWVIDYDITKRIDGATKKLERSLWDAVIEQSLISVCRYDHFPRIGHASMLTDMK